MVNASASVPEIEDILVLKVYGQWWEGSEEYIPLYTPEQVLGPCHTTYLRVMEVRESEKI